MTAKTVGDQLKLDSATRSLGLDAEDICTFGPGSWEPIGKLTPREHGNPSVFVQGLPCLF